MRNPKGSFSFFLFHNWKLCEANESVRNICDECILFLVLQIFMS